MHTQELSYHHFEIYFIKSISDFPDPPKVSPQKCSKDADDDSCHLFKGLQNGVSDISEILLVINRILTTKGLKFSSEDFSKSEIPSDWLRSVGDTDIKSNRPGDNIIAEAGTHWFNDTETQLILRSILANPDQPLNKRHRRWVKEVLKPLATMAVGAIGYETIPDLFDDLFVGDNSILSYLTGYKLLTKKEYEQFADLPKYVSELQTETKKLFRELLASTETVKTLSQQLEATAETQELRFSTVEEAFLMEQRTIGDIIRSLYTSIVYNVHFNAYEECRNSLTPTAFIPPSLLQQRLRQIERNLPENIMLAIPPSSVQRYYKLPLTECVYDSNGGMAKLLVPLVEKDSSYKLYTFKALQFSNGQQTCTMDTGASFIIKDTTNNRVFSITDLDKETCTPTRNGICQVPLASSDDSTNFCVQVLLR